MKRFLYSCTTLLFFIAPSLIAAPRFVDGTYLIVNSQMLTYSEFKEALSSSQEQIQKSSSTEAEKQKALEKLEAQVLENLRQELLLLDRAASLKIKASDQEVTQRMTQIEKNNPQFFQSYAEFELRIRIKKEIKKQRLLGREVDSKIRVSEEEILQFCIQKQSENRSLTLSQILIRRPQAEAEQVLRLVEQGVSQGQNFSMLALQYSEDPGVSNNGGKLGVFKKGELLKSINDAAFLLKKGELSPLVQSSFGYHILYIDEEQQISKKKCSELSTRESRPYSSALFSQKRASLLQSYIKKLKAAAKISLYPPPSK